PRPVPRRAAGTRIVCDAPDGVLPELADGSMMMLGELLAAIGHARSSIYIEHQYLTSRPIVAALAAALQREPALEIIIVLNQNPDLTAYRGWQNARLEEHRLLAHPRVGVFALWAVDEDPVREGVTRISQLFIHSKIIVIDDEWAAVGTSNLDGVSMGDYGDDFASRIGRRIFRGVRNVEVNVVIDARGEAELTGEDAEPIVELRERLWEEHLGIPRALLSTLAAGGALAAWRRIARENVRMLSGAGVAGQASASRRAGGHVLPYSVCAFPREQLEELEIQLSDELVLCYNPGWLEVHAAVHWIRNIF
ncbi:MAG: phospholipase D-like domain-containing protein, partial [Gemmatimonadaceae bacterium]